MNEKDNKKLKALHSNLKGTYDLPDYDTFASNLTDTVKSKAFYETLSKDGYNMPPDYDTFINDLGLKKKDLYKTLGFGRDLVKEVFGEDGVEKPPVTEKPEELSLSPELETPDLTLTTPESDVIPKTILDSMLHNSVKDPTRKKEEKESIPGMDYITALPQGFNMCMGEAIRNTGAWLNLPTESIADLAGKVMGKGNEKGDMIEQVIIK